MGYARDVNLSFGRLTIHFFFIMIIIIIKSINERRKTNLNIKTNPVCAHLAEWITNDLQDVWRYTNTPAGKKTDNNNNTVENPFGPLNFVYW